MKKSKVRISSWNYISERENRKRTWRSSGINSAFKSYLPYHYRIPALQRFYKIVENSVKLVYKLAKVPFEVNDTRKVKAQLSICYSNYPSVIAVQAASGHTVWIQWKKLNNKSNHPYILPQETLNAIEEQDIDIKSFENLFQQCAKSVHERMISEELKRSGLEQVEAYRIFLTNYSRLKMESLPEIINTVVMFGDLLPEIKKLKLHYVTQKICDIIIKICYGYFDKTKNADLSNLNEIGNKWATEMAFTLRFYLPKEQDLFLDVPNNGHGLAIHPDNPPIPKPGDIFPGFNRPAHPTLEEEKDLVQKLNKRLERENNSLKEITKVPQDKLPAEAKKFIESMQQVVNTVTASSGQNNKIEDTRSEIITDSLLNNQFQPGPIEGSKAEGNEVEVDLGFGNNLKAQIFDKAFDPCFEQDEINYLIEEAESLTAKMKRNIYPNTEELPVMEKLKTNGILDSSRLPVYNFSEAMYKRIIHKKEYNKNGRPVVLIVADGSGSMNYEKMHMLKLLCVAWMGSTLNSSVQVIGGVYNTDTVDSNRHGPLIRWISHPTKTPSNSKKEAMRTVASIPNSGSGAQADALSLSYMIQEAETVARGKQLYVIHITDTGWVNSFSNGLSAEDEVVSVMQRKSELLKDRLHYTLVGLGVTTAGKLENVANKLITLSSSELSQPLEAASKIGVYVSSCIKERNKYRNK